MNLYQHLEERHLNINRYPTLWLDQDEGLIIFPLWNLSGQMIGYQQYRPGADKKQKNNPREGRYYTSLHGKKGEKPLAVWGLESYYYRSDVLVVVEGVFDACRFHNFDIPAIALLNGSYKHYRNWLNSTSRRRYKVEDDHGSTLGPYRPLELPCGRSDVGECSDDEISQIIETFV